MAKTVEELKTAFAKGKYPTSEDYAAIIDLIGGGSSIKIFEINDEGLYGDDDNKSFDVYNFEDWNNLPKNTIVVIINKTDYPVRGILCYEDSGENVVIAQRGAAMVIRTNDNNGNYSHWSVIGVPIN